MEIQVFEGLLELVVVKDQVTLQLLVQLMVMQEDREVVVVRDLLQEQEHITTDLDVQEQETHLLQLLLKEIQAEQDT